MISRYEAVLNGVGLSGLDADILIHDIKHSPSAFTDNRYSVAKRNGLRTDKRSFSSVSVTIVFEIHAYSVMTRRAICDAVCAWAKDGGKLETNDKNGQFLQCVCTQFPSVESTRNWTDELSVTFTAFEIPFWQESVQTIVTFSAGTSGTKDFFVPGSGDDNVIEAIIRANASLSSVAITVNGRTLTLSGLSVAQNKEIKILYDDKGIQSIKVDNTSLLNKRTGVDDLLAKCGKINTASFTASASVNVTLRTRGLWV